MVDPFPLQGLYYPLLKISTLTKIDILTTGPSKSPNMEYLELC